MGSWCWNQSGRDYSDPWPPGPPAENPYGSQPVASPEIAPTPTQSEIDVHADQNPDRRRPRPERSQRLRRWPARLDLLQSASGLALGLFMWVHMFFVASILLGKDAMWTVARMFEGYFIFGSGAVLARLAAGRRSWRRCSSCTPRSRCASFRRTTVSTATYRDHLRQMRHEDTTLWYWQVVTGFALFFLASVHLYIMMTRPTRSAPTVRPTASGATRCGRCTSCCCSRSSSTAASASTASRSSGAGSSAATRWRRVASCARSSGRLTAFFLVLGLATLAAYMKIGIEHAPYYGQPYVPAELATEVAP